MKPKPKHLLIAILIFAATENLCAQIPTWKWAKSAIGNEYDQSSTVATDASGNVYVAGYFASDFITFGTVTLLNTGLGFDEIFIAKYDSSGNLLWAKSAGGSSDDKAFSVTTDAAGNVYLTGYFYSPTITFGTYTLTNAGAVGDIFIVKYDNMGNVLWATREGGPGLEIPYSIHVDSTGNITVVGRFSSLSITFGTYTLTQAGSMDVFVVKYDAAGNVLWARGAGGGSNDEAYAVDVDAAGNVLVAGYFNQNAVFGTITLNTAGQADVFLAKYDASGTVLWAKRAGGNGDDRATSLSVDASGNSYIAGFFTNDSISFGTITLPNAPGDNSFIAKYDAVGNVLWAHGVSGDSKALALTLTPGNVYACGVFNGDTLTYGPSALIIDGNADFFLLNCDVAGIAKWAIKQTSGGGSNEYATSISTDAWDNIIIGGYFDSDPIAFGPSVLSNTGNGFDMFVARLGVTPTGIEHLQNENELVMYPNPAISQLRVSSRQYAISSVEIYDVMGQKVFIRHQEISGRHQVTIDVSQFTEGIYFIRIFVGKKQYTKKLIIQ